MLLLEKDYKKSSLFITKNEKFIQKLGIIDKNKEYSMPDVVFSTKCFYDRITTSDERR